MLNELGKTLLQQIAACHDYISSEELSKICNVSINAIRKEIDLINDYLRGHGCFIDTKIAAGYFLTLDQPELARPFLAKMLKEFRQFRYLNYSEFSTAYTIAMRLLTASSYTTIDALTNSLYCSKSTVLRTLDQTQLILDQFHLDLKNKRNYGLYIEGDEGSKRICLIFMHKVYVHENPQLVRTGVFNALFLNHTDYPGVVRECVLNYFRQHQEITIPNIHFVKLAQYLALAKTRSSHAGEIHFSADQIRQLHSLPVYSASQTIYASLPAYFQEGVTETDILSFAALIACCMTVKHPSRIPENERAAIEAEVREITAFIAKYYDVSGIFDDHFHQDFTCYLYGLHLKMEFNFSSDAEKLPGSTKIGLLSADISSLFALFYKVKHGVYLREVDLVDAYYIFNSALYKNNAYYNKMNLAIVSRHGRYYSENLADRMRVQYGRYIQTLDILEYTEVFACDLEHYDAIITDVNRNILPKTYAGALIDSNLNHIQSDLNSLSTFLIQRFNAKARTLFREKNFHKCSFTSQMQVYDAIYKLYQNEIGDHEHFIHDLKMRSSFISYEKEKNIILITPLALRIAQPVFEVFVNKKPMLWERAKASVYIFYQQGNGSKENVQIISYLLKQFIHQNELFINTLYDRSYKDVVGIFHVL